METDINFGATLSWWDRLFGTYREKILDDLEAMPLGLEGLEEERGTSIHRLLALPPCGALSRRWSLLDRNRVIGRKPRTQLSSSPGQFPTPGPLQIRTRRFPPSGSSAGATCGYPPHSMTVMRGSGRGKR